MKIMTIEQFLKNPSGFKSASFARRDIIIENLKSRFNKLYGEKQKEFSLKTFIKGKDYILYFKIPSETVPELLFDVVLQFTPLSNADAELTINHYSVQVFSNSPGFTFTYAYIYNKEGILIDFLRNKISSTAITTPPVIRNNEEIIGFEKSVYYALLYLKAMGYTYKSNLRRTSQIIKETSFLIRNVKSSESKMLEYNNLKKKYKLLQQEEKAKKLKSKNEAIKKSNAINRAKRKK